MKHILLIEDDRGIREAFNYIFDPADYRVEVIDNGEKIVNNDFEVPDLFILDKQISGIDGLDICRYIKGHSQMKHIPVIMLSASPCIAELARTAGADDALKKPFDIKELRQVVARYLP